MQLSKNFELSEFACKCCGQTPDPNDHEFRYFVSILQEVRDLCKFPLKIVSGYRCEKHNKKVGGVKDSSHLKGIAVDIEITNDYSRLILIQSALEVNIKRIGISKTFIHLDIDDTKNNAIWVY